MTSTTDYSLTNTIVGDTITIGCVIETCGTPNNVSFVRDDGTVVENIVRPSDGAFNWNPTVTRNLRGTYRCVAVNPLGNDSQSFMITGIYIILPYILTSFNTSCMLY